MVILISIMICFIWDERRRRRRRLGVDCTINRLFFFLSFQTIFTVRAASFPYFCTTFFRLSFFGRSILTRFVSLSLGWLSLYFVATFVLDLSVYLYYVQSSLYALCQYHMCINILARLSPRGDFSISWTACDCMLRPLV